LSNCFAVVGFGGNGTIYSLIAAELIPALLKGKRPSALAFFLSSDERRDIKDSAAHVPEEF
jgi:hypothetical protein